MAVKEELQKLNQIERIQRFAQSNGWVNTNEVIREYSSNLQELSALQEAMIKSFNSTMENAVETLKALRQGNFVFSQSGTPMTKLDYTTLVGSAARAGYTTIRTGTRTVTTAGTAVQVTASATACNVVYLSADLGNTGPVVVGGSTVVAANNLQQGIVLVGGNQPVELYINDLSKLYVDAQNNGDKLCYAYL